MLRFQQTSSLLIPSFCCTLSGGLPDEIAIPIQAGYDISLLDHFKGSVSSIHNYIAGAIELSKPNFRQGTSLPYKVKD